MADVDVLALWMSAVATCVSLWEVSDFSSGAPEWAQLKFTLLMRIRVAAASEQFAKQVLQRTRELNAALEAERQR